MSRSAGTGSPVYFHCHAWRRDLWRGPSEDHVVTLTGRVRPYRAGRTHALGLRSDHISREYRCSCGHVGWSNHADLGRMARPDAHDEATAYYRVHGHWPGEVGT